VQATVHRLDPATGSGSVVTDAGIVLPFDADVLAASRLRHVRVGQRLTVTVDGTGAGQVVASMHLGTVGAVAATASAATGSAQTGSGDPRRR
jgi:hypothetical protein